MKKIIRSEMLQNGRKIVLVWTLVLLCKWSNFILNYYKYMRTKEFELC